MSPGQPTRFRYHFSIGVAVDLTVLVPVLLVVALSIFLVVSTAVWAGTYLAGPGRGRPLLLGAAAVGLWLTVLQVTEEVTT